MELDAYIKILLAILIWREARSDGVDAMRAVAHVVRNRVNAWHGTWINVITSKNQFSSISIIGDSQTVVWPREIDVSPFSIANSIFDGTDPDNTGGALYYANEATENSGWYNQHIIDSPEHPVLVKIGQQTFRR